MLGWCTWFLMLTLDMTDVPLSEADHMTTCDAEEGSRIQGYTWKRELYVYVMCDTSDYRAGMIAECCPTRTSVSAASLISMTVPRGTTLLVTGLSNG